MNLTKPTSILVLSALFIQILTPVYVEAKSLPVSASSNSVKLEPVSNKVDKLESMGVSGVDPHSGALTYSYPISLPEGRNGNTPDLALSYRSDNAQLSNVGFGWDININKIYRTSKYGLDNMYTTNSLASTVHGELVYTKDKTFEPRVKADDVVYSLVGDTIRADYPNGSVHIYGNTIESRTADIAGGRIGEWYLTKSIDQYGNAISYEYLKSGNIPRISKIVYSEHANFKAPFEVLFSYKDFAKSDSYQFGFLTSYDKLLSQIIVKSESNDVAYIDITHQTAKTSGKALLTSITERRAGSDLSFTALPSVTFEYEQSEIIFDGSSKPVRAPMGEAYDENQYYGISRNLNTFVADTDGNGVYEFINDKPGTLFLDLYSDGRQYRHNEDGRISLVDGKYIIAKDVTRVLDVNNDGFDDLFTNSGVYLFSSKGFVLSPLYTKIYNGVSLQDTLIDLNSDGLTDRISKSTTISSTTYSVYFGNGTSFNVLPEIIYSYPFSTKSFDDGVRFADINNDGLVDILHSYNSESKNATCQSDSVFKLTPPLMGSMYIEKPSIASVDKVLLNKGTKFELVENISIGSLASYEVCMFWYSQYFDIKGQSVIDRNGDNLADIGTKVNKTKRQNLMTGIKTGTGAMSNIVYESSINIDKTQKTKSRYVVKEIKTTSVSGDTLPSTIYEYDGGFMYTNRDNPYDRKLSGFDTVKVTVGGLTTITKYHQGNGTSSTEYQDSYDLIGLPYQILQIDNKTGQKLNETRLGYEINKINKSTLVSKTVSTYGVFDGEDIKEWAINITKINSDNGMPKEELVGSLSKLNYDLSLITDRDVKIKSKTLYKHTLNKPFRNISKEVYDDESSLINQAQIYYDNKPYGYIGKGSITKSITNIYRNDSKTPNTLVQTFVYNTAGNLVKEIGVDGITKNYKYDVYGINVSEISSPVTKIINENSLHLGAPVKSDLNGVVTNKKYDGLGKVTEEYVSAGNEKMARSETNYMFTPFGYIVTNTTFTSGGIKRDQAVYDSFGRKKYSKNQIDTNKFLTNSIYYDANGNIAKISNMTTDNQLGGEPIIRSFTEFKYDSQGRATSLNNESGGALYSYSGHSIKIVDAKNPSIYKHYSYDVFGDLTLVRSGEGDDLSSTKYIYDSLGNINQINKNNQVITNIVYDGMGRKIKYQSAHELEDSNFPEKNSFYNNHGQLERVDTKESSKKFFYSSNNNLIKIEETRGGKNYTTSFNYDGCAVGRVDLLCSVRNDDGEIVYSYDKFGRINKTKVNVDENSYVRTIVYNSDNLISTYTYPDNVSHIYDYYLNGEEKSVSLKTVSGDLIKIADRLLGDDGSTDEIRYGNGIRKCIKRSDKYSVNIYAGFDVLYNSASCDDNIGSTSLHNENVVIDNGNINSKSVEFIDIDGTKRKYVSDYLFDSNNRLINSKLTYGTTSIIDSFVYDQNGRIISKNGISYTYDTFSDSGAYGVSVVGNNDYVYDLDGNVVSDAIRSLSYGSDGRVVKVKKGQNIEESSYLSTGEKIKTKYAIVDSGKTNSDINTVIKERQSLALDSLSKTSSESTSIEPVITDKPKKYISKESYLELNGFGIYDAWAVNNLFSEIINTRYFNSKCVSSLDKNLCIKEYKKAEIYNVLNSIDETRNVSVQLLEDILNIRLDNIQIPKSVEYYDASSTIYVKQRAIDAQTRAVSVTRNADGSKTERVANLYGSEFELSNSKNELYFTISGGSYRKDGYKVDNFKLSLFDMSKTYITNYPTSYQIGLVIDGDINQSSVNDYAKKEVIKNSREAISAYNDNEFRLVYEAGDGNQKILNQKDLTVRFAHISGSSPTSPSAFIAGSNRFTGSTAMFEFVLSKDGEILKRSTTTYYVKNNDSVSVIDKIEVISEETKNVLGKIGIIDKKELENFLSNFECFSVCNNDSKKLVFEFIYSNFGIKISDRVIAEMYGYVYGDISYSYVGENSKTLTLSEIDAPITACASNVCKIDFQLLDWNNPYLQLAKSTSSRIKSKIIFESVSGSEILDSSYVRNIEITPWGTVASSTKGTTSSNFKDNQFVIDSTNILRLGKASGIYSNTVYENTYSYEFYNTLKLSKIAEAVFATNTPKAKIVFYIEKPKNIGVINGVDIPSVFGVSSTVSESYDKDKYFGTLYESFKKKNPHIANMYSKKEYISKEAFVELSSASIYSSDIPKIVDILEYASIDIGSSSEALSALSAIYPRLSENSLKELYAILAGLASIPSSHEVYENGSKQDITSKWSMISVRLVTDYGNREVINGSGANIICGSNAEGRWSNGFNSCILAGNSEYLKSLDTNKNRYVLSMKVSYTNPVYANLPIEVGHIPSISNYHLASNCVSYCNYPDSLVNRAIFSTSSIPDSEGNLKVDITDLIKNANAKGYIPKDIIFGKTPLYNQSIPFTLSDIKVTEISLAPTALSVSEKIQAKYASTSSTISLNTNNYLTHYYGYYMGNNNISGLCESAKINKNWVIYNSTCSVSVNLENYNPSDTYLLTGDILAIDNNAKTGMVTVSLDGQKGGVISDDNKTFTLDITSQFKAVNSYGSNRSLIINPVHYLGQMQGFSNSIRISNIKLVKEIVKEGVVTTKLVDKITYDKSVILSTTTLQKLTERQLLSTLDNAQNFYLLNEKGKNVIGDSISKKSENHTMALNGADGNVSCNNNCALSHYIDDVSVPTYYFTAPTISFKTERLTQELASLTEYNLELPITVDTSYYWIPLKVEAFVCSDSTCNKFEKIQSQTFANSKLSVSVKAIPNVDKQYIFIAKRGSWQIGSMNKNARIEAGVKLETVTKNSNSRFRVASSTRSHLAKYSLDNEGVWNMLYKSIDTSVCDNVTASTTCVHNLKMNKAKEIIGNLTGSVFSDKILAETYAVYLGLAIFDERYSTSSLVSASTSLEVNSLSTLDITNYLVALDVNIGSTTVDLEKVPMGFLTDEQFIQIYGKTLGVTKGTSTKPISNSTYNELLQTGIRSNDDVYKLYNNAKFVLGCDVTASTTSCDDGALNNAVRDYISSRYGIRISDMAIYELGEVNKKYFTVLPDLNAVYSSTTRLDIVKVEVDNKTSFRTDSVVSLNSDNASGTTPQVVSATNTVLGICAISSTQSCTVSLPGVNTYIDSSVVTLKASTTDHTRNINLKMLYDEVVISTTTGTSTVETVTVTISTSTPTTFTSGEAKVELGTLLQDLLGRNNGRLEIEIIKASNTDNIVIDNVNQVYSYMAVYDTITYSSSTHTLSQLVTRPTHPTSTSYTPRTLTPNTLNISGDLHGRVMTRGGEKAKTSDSYYIKKFLKVDTMSLSFTPGTFDCIPHSVGSFSYIIDWNHCQVGYGKYGNTGAGTEWKIDINQRETYKQDKEIKIWKVHFDVTKTPESNLKAGDQITICALYHNQTNPDCTKDQYFVSSTTATVGQTANLDITFNILNTSWPHIGLTAIKFGLDTSKNPQAGIIIKPTNNSGISAGYITTTTTGKSTNDTQVHSYITDNALNYELHEEVLNNNFKKYEPKPYISTTTIYQNSSNEYIGTYTVYTPYPNYEVSTRNQTTHYITLQNEVVATYSYNTDNPSIYNIQYIVNNELNTPVLYTDTEGKVSRTHHTDTSGNIIHNSTRADVHHSKESFATYQTLPASGLLYAQARLYDPVTSLFLQEDPLAPSLPQVYITDPEQQNSYSYARNNPVTYTDPSGAYIESALDIAFIAYDIGDITYQIYKLATGNGSKYDLVTSVLSLGADVGGLLTPFGTGFGVATRVARGAHVPEADKFLDLAWHEAQGGHTILKHVSKEVDELVYRARQENRDVISTFFDSAAAQKALNDFYSSHLDVIKEFANSKDQVKRITIETDRVAGLVYDKLSNSVKASGQVFFVLNKNAEGGVFIKTMFPSLK